MQAETTTPPPKRGARPPIPEGSGQKRGARPPIPEGSRQKRGARPPIPEGSEQKRGARPPIPEGSEQKRGARPPIPEGSRQKRGARPPIPEGSRPGARFTAGWILLAGAALALVLHLLAGLRYPVPWPDEAHFLAPARALASSLTLASPALNAPEGIFWMPDGYAVVMGLVYAVAPDTVTVARLVSLALTLAAAGALYAVGVRLGASRLLAASVVALWLVAPRVVLMGNIARMEPLLLALIGAALVLATSERWLGALAVSSLAVLVHPSGLAMALAVAGAVVLLRPRLRHPDRLEWLLLAVAALAWTAEALWLWGHLEIVREHLAFQLRRKSARAQDPNAIELGVALVGVVGLAACLVGRSRLGVRRASVLAALFGLIGALSVVRVSGNEMWYGVLGYETPALLLVLALLVLAPALRAGTPAAPPRAVLAVAVTAIAAVAGVTLTGSAYDMAIGLPSPGDRAFRARLEPALSAFDAQQHHRVLVAFDRSSGLSPFLLERDWRHLRFVDPTPVTPLRQTPDYILYTLGPPEPGRRRIAKRLPPGPPALAVTAPGSTAAVLLYPADPDALPIT